MRKILIVSFVFPPGGGGGVQRTANFSKYLKKFNYEPIILTVKEDLYQTKGLPFDESLKEKIKGLKVLRTSHLDVWKISRSFSRIHLGWLIDFIFIPDYQIAWAFRAIKEGLRIIKKYNIGIIYATCPPYSTALIGILLKKLSRKALIVDFRDPWTQCLAETWSGKFRYNIEESLEGFTLSVADHIIANTPQSRRMLLDKFRNLSPDNITTINSGFDREDFTNFKSSHSKRSKRKMMILHAGHFYGKPPEKDDLWEPGSLRKVREKLKYRPEKVNMSAHSPYYFFKAISNLFKKELIKPSGVHIVLLGQVHEKFHQMIYENLNLYKSVEILDYQAHEITLKYIQRADLLLFTLYKPLERPYLECIPGKAYEYMASKKPILGLVPEGDAKELLQKTGLAYFAAPDDVPEIEKTILNLYNYYHRNTIPVSPQKEFIYQYNYYNLTKKLCDVFNRIAK